MIKSHKTLVSWAVLLSLAGIGFGVFTSVVYKQHVPLLTLQGLQLQRSQTTTGHSSFAAANNRPLPVATTIASSLPTPPPSAVTTVVGVRQISPSYVVSPPSQQGNPPSSSNPSPPGSPNPSPPSGGSNPGGPPDQPSCQQYNDTFASSNWAGYAAKGGNYTSVSGTWQATNPSGVANVLSSDSTWVGIGGWDVPDLIQAGTTNFIHSDGTRTSWAWYELLPNRAIPVPSIPVNGGDTIQVSITQVSSGRWTISITNKTTYSRFTTTVSYASSLATAEWIQEDPSCDPNHRFPLDIFGSVSFTNGSAVENGKTLNIAGTKPTQITLMNLSTRQPLATPSAIAGDGASFTVTQQH